MSRRNKILTIVFILLILITLAEVFYYFFNILPNQQSRTSQSNTLNQEGGLQRPQQQNNAQSDGAISTDVVNLITSFNKDLLTESTLDMTFQGQISDIVVENNNESKENRGNALFIVLINENNSMAIRIFQVDQGITFYLDRDTKERSTFDFNSPKFKIGDNVAININLNLIKPFRESAEFYGITIL
jgi:hypothetical protein